jgi:glycine/D-amino acid oxidase-like deaminating enzyme
MLLDHLARWVSKHALRALLRRIEQLQLAESMWNRTPIVRQWACQRAFTPDRTMRLGRDPQRPWLVWAAGLGGHGATASPAVGETVAEACIAALG